MKISIILDDDKEYPLNRPDLDRRESPSNLRINGQRLVQEVGLIRADESSFFPRGQHKNTVSFGIAKLFETVDEAQEYVLDMAGDIPDGKFIRFAYGDDLTKYRYLRTGLVTVSDVDQQGCSVFVNFTIVGGKFSSSEPEA